MQPAQGVVAEKWFGSPPSTDELDGFLTGAVFVCRDTAHGLLPAHSSWRLTGHAVRAWKYVRSIIYSDIDYREYVI